MTREERLAMFAATNGPVRALSTIPDNPLAVDDATARRGDVGHIVDISDGLVYVDFGRGAIPCDPFEIE